MHLLPISLLTILVGTLLLAKFKKDQVGKFFIWISWFFIVVGFILFIGFIGGGICKMKYHCFNRHESCQREMMERGHDHGMQGGNCCCPMHMEGQCNSMEQFPAPVKEAFAKIFPTATDVKYEMEREDYEITFKDKGVGMSANFDATGKWQETETEIKESDLPKEVSASVAKNFAGFKISEVAKVESPDKGLYYEMDLKNDKEGYEVQFSPKGDILNKHPLKKEKEEKEENEKK